MAHALVKDIPVRIEAGPATVDGDLANPKLASGLVVFAHGSGSSRFSERNRSVAHALNEHGFGTLLMDLLTREEERIDVMTREFRFDIPLLAERVIAAVDWCVRDARVRERPNDADAHYQIGAAYGFLASYTATVEGRVFESLKSARRAYREHERALALAPARKDAGLVVGMYRYAVSELSLPLRLAAMLAGMGSGRERGLRMVEEAAGYPSEVQPNALFTLVLLYNREKRYDDAMRVIRELQRRFPRNRLLWLEAGSTADALILPSAYQTCMVGVRAAVCHSTSLPWPSFHRNWPGACSTTSLTFAPS